MIVKKDVFICSWFDFDIINDNNNKNTRSEISVKCDGVDGDLHVLNTVCDQCSIMFTFSLSYLLTKGGKPALIEAVAENKNNDKIPQL